MFFQNFPYTDYHSLNLDWLLDVSKETIESIKSIPDLVEKASLKFADPIEWDVNRTYQERYVVSHGGGSYVSKQYVPAGTDIANTDYWAKIADYDVQVDLLNQKVEAVKAESEFAGRSVCIIGASNETPVAGVTKTWAQYFADYALAAGATRVENVAVGGSKLMTSGLLDQVNRATPADIYVITLPNNDFRSLYISPVDYIGHFNTLIARIRTINTVSTIYVRGMAASESKALGNQNYLGFYNAFVKARCDDLGCHFIDRSVYLGYAPGGAQLGNWTIDGIHYSDYVTPQIGKAIFNFINSASDSTPTDCYAVLTDLTALNSWCNASVLNQGILKIQYSGGNALDFMLTMNLNTALTAAGGTIDLGTGRLFNKLSNKTYGSMCGCRVAGDATARSVWFDPSSSALYTSNASIGAGMNIHVYGTLQVDGSIGVLHNN